MAPFLKRTYSYFLLLLLVAGIGSCDTIDLYEKVEPIPGHEWKSAYKPSFTFNIKDTASPYQLFVIVRHNNRYGFNNLWITLNTASPDGTTASAQYELPLATNDRGWLGTGMDDLYEHRIALTPVNQKFYFQKPGTYTFTLGHIMREDPLLQVMNVGLRIEKK